MTKLAQIAHLINRLTYDEMMEMASAFSEWTSVDDEGNDQTPTIDRDLMACNLSDWADEILMEEDND